MVYLFTITSYSGELFCWYCNQCGFIAKLWLLAETKLKVGQEGKTAIGISVNFCCKALDRYMIAYVKLLTPGNPLNHSYVMTVILNDYFIIVRAQITYKLLQVTSSCLKLVYSIFPRKVSLVSCDWLAENTAMYSFITLRFQKVSGGIFLLVYRLQFESARFVLTLPSLCNFLFVSFR